MVGVAIVDPAKDLSVFPLLAPFLGYPRALGTQRVLHHSSARQRARAPSLPLVADHVVLYA